MNKPDESCSASQQKLLSTKTVLAKEITFMYGRNSDCYDFQFLEKEKMTSSR